MRFFRLEEGNSPLYSWSLRTKERWQLPGVRCPQCHEIFAILGEAYPTVDLSRLPEQALFQARAEEDFTEFTRLRELVRPLVPEGATLAPGTRLGPLSGTAQGHFPPIVLPEPWTLFMRAEALEKLQGEGVRGLKGCPTALRFRERSHPELLEIQVEPRGRFHPDCLPPGAAVPCPTCGREGFKMPAEPILDAATLPTDRDLFRLSHYWTAMVGTERFVDAVRRLGFDDVEFRELPVRHLN